ncbi:hypothetical protein [Clostridium intestinale]|uniref:Uncharacterized protein n=1 Tax=Clostridium intestinale URNW TaxID=1294142 RepID=U2PUL2_9CLOT|nr:hypothetical protein [Clostridium intestinale]ERK30115.1 hypothetical protein CINTURNW_1732 [Clostridium intestinale URNW]
MDTDNKKLFKYLGIIFISVLICYKLPHSSYSIIEYIIRPIRINYTTIYLAGLVPLVLFIIGIKGLFKLKRNEKKSKFFIFIVTVFVIIPIMKWSLGFARSSYHFIIKDGLNSLDIIDSKVNLGSNNNDFSINVNMEIIDYGSSNKDFKVKVYLPKSLTDILGEEVYDLERSYNTYGHKGKIYVNEKIVLKNVNEKMHGEIFKTMWSFDPIRYELYNNDQSIKIVDYRNKFL